MILPDASKKIQFWHYLEGQIQQKQLHLIFGRQTQFIYRPNNHMYHTNKYNVSYGQSVYRTDIKTKCFWEKSTGLSCIQRITALHPDRGENKRSLAKHFPFTTLIWKTYLCWLKLKTFPLLSILVLHKDLATLLCSSRSSTTAAVFRKLSLGLLCHDSCLLIALMSSA